MECTLEETEIVVQFDKHEDVHTGCTYEDVHTRMYIRGCTHKDVHTRMYIAGCTYGMYLWDVHTRMYIRGCTYTMYLGDNVHSDNVHRQCT